MRIGVDVGGTKIEAIALDAKGAELQRIRTATPKGEYAGTIAAIVGLVKELETVTGQTGTVGVGIPGTIVGATGLVKNANSTWLNGKPLQKDLSAALGREVRCANDANCFAISEATDGAAKDYEVVFGVIFGTGCGGGVCFGGHVHNGPNGLAGEWGHTPLPWATGRSELPGAAVLLRAPRVFGDMDFGDRAGMGFCSDEQPQFARSGDCRGCGGWRRRGQGSARATDRSDGAGAVDGGERAGSGCVCVGGRVIESASAVRRRVGEPAARLWFWWRGGDTDPAQCAWRLEWGAGRGVVVATTKK